MRQTQSTDPQGDHGSACSARIGDIEVRLARDSGEVEAAQRLRYQVFYTERGAAADAPMRAAARDRDRYDALMDHLVVLDHGGGGAPSVVGTYRLLQRDRLPSGDAFYSSGEFDLAPLLQGGGNVLELGRSCVLQAYRTRPVLPLLWRAIAGYVADHRIPLMFGCASFSGTDPARWREQLAYLHHFHLAPPASRPRALGPTRLSMEVMLRAQVDPVRALAGLEPIIKGYLRAGAGIGDGAFIDHQFNSIDVCIVLPTDQLTLKYRRHFETALQRPLLAANAAC